MIYLEHSYCPQPWWPELEFFHQPIVLVAWLMYQAIFNFDTQGVAYCDPKGIQFELLLAHFEQLRLVYEMQEDEEGENV